MSDFREKIKALQNKPEQDWTDDDYGTGLTFVIGTFLFIAILIALPFGLIFSLNTLFATKLAYTIGTWFSVYFMFFVLKVVLLMISKRFKENV